MEDALARHVTEYAASPVVEYALLLRGDWGTGKTYYYKNTLVPLLEEQDREPAGSSDSVKLKPIHISLFGIGDDDFHKTIVLSCSTTKELVDTHLPTLKKNLRKTTESVPGNVLRGFVESYLPALNSIKFSSISLDGLDNKKGLFICFDDLERSSVSSNVFLAAVNRLTEFLNIPVLVVCNEKKYSKDNNDEFFKRMDDASKDASENNVSMQEPRANPYELGKEKCIRAVDFKADVDKTVKIILTSGEKDAVQEFFSQHTERFVAIFNAADCNNFRFIKRIINDFRNHIFPIWKQVKIEQEHKDDNRLYDMFIFYSSCVIELEFRHISPDDFHSIELDPFLFNMKKDSQYNIKTHSETYFTDYPFEAYQRQLWFDSIFSFVQNGFLDAEHLVRECKPQFIENLDDISQVLDIPFENWYKMDDARFDTCYRTIMSALDKRSLVDEKQFFKAYYLLKAFVEKNAVDLSDDKRIELMDKNFETLYERIGSDFIDKMLWRDRTVPDEKLNDYFARLKQKSDENEKRRKAEVLDELVKTVVEGRSVRTLNRHFDELYSTFGLKEEHAERLYCALVDKGNDVAHEICEFLIWRFDDKNFPGKIREESAFIQRLRSHLDSYFDSGKKKMPKNLNLIALCDKLKQLEDSLAKSS